MMFIARPKSGQTLPRMLALAEVRNVFRSTPYKSRAPRPRSNIRMGRSLSLPKGHVIIPDVMEKSDRYRARAVVNAVIALQNPRGSTAEDIKKYLISQGEVARDDDIKPAILAALKSNKLCRPQGSRGRFLFWDDNKEAANSRRMRRYRCHPRPKKARKRRRKSRPRRRRRSRSRGSRCRRSRGKKSRRSGSSCKKISKSFMQRISNMKVGSGKKLVVFCARKKK